MIAYEQNTYTVLNPSVLEKKKIRIEKIWFLIMVYFTVECILCIKP